MRILSSELVWTWIGLSLLYAFTCILCVKLFNQVKQLKNRIEHYNKNLSLEINKLNSVFMALDEYHKLLSKKIEILNTKVIQYDSEARNSIKILSKKITDLGIISVDQDHFKYGNTTVVISSTLRGGFVKIIHGKCESAEELKNLVEDLKQRYSIERINLDTPIRNLGKIW